MRNNPERARENGRRWYRKNTEKARMSSRVCLWKKIGASLEDYAELFWIQRGRCAICEAHDSELTRHLAIDHDHRTGMIRGLLCGNCNRGMGLFFDKPGLLIRASSYLNDDYLLSKESDYTDA